MSSNHDPFPMQSNEAAALAASVEKTARGDVQPDNDEEGDGGGGNAVSSWNRMKTGPSGHGGGGGVGNAASSHSKRSSKKSAAAIHASQSLLTTTNANANTNTNTNNNRHGSTRQKSRNTNVASFSMDCDQPNVDEDDDDSDDDSEDDYFDRPINTTYSPTRPFSLFLYARDHWWCCCCPSNQSHRRRRHHSTKSCQHLLSKSFTKLFRNLYGTTVPLQEIQRVCFLSLTLFFIIGGYWLLRSLKDPVLTALCGVDVIPRAKIASVFVVLAVVSIYNKLLSYDNSSGSTTTTTNTNNTSSNTNINLLAKHVLFYIFGMSYFILFTIIAILLTNTEIGLPNQIPNPNRLLGWISYCAIESFGSVMVSLFWSFANSVISLESAKASYGLMVATAQIGSILGPTIVQRYASTIGVASCYFIGALCMLLLQVAMYAYVKIYGTEGADGDGDSDGGGIAADAAKKAKSSNKAGVTEGLVLFWKYDYVKGIFAISCLFMVEVTIVDYMMKVLGNDHFAELHPCHSGYSCWDPVTNSAQGLSQQATEAFTTFMGLFGQATNTLSFFMSLFGTSAVLRALGLRSSLILFPVLCLIIIVMVRLSPTLWIVFAAMMLLKALTYALNNPTKEILYQPTSQAVKYKAKSWIDIFGARGSKALGSLVTNAFSDSTEQLVTNGSLVGMVVAVFLVFNARYMGRTFDEYVKTGYVVGQEEEDEALAMMERDLLDIDADEKDRYGGDEDDDEGDGGRDTSCALYDDTHVGTLEEGQMHDEATKTSKGSKDNEGDEDSDLDDLIKENGDGTAKQDSHEAADIIKI